MDAHIPYLAQDAVFTLDQLVALNRSDPNGILTGPLDLQRAGLFGMSMGAVVGGEACRLERRLRAGLLLDAMMAAEVVRAGLGQPIMWITGDADTMRLDRRRARAVRHPAQSAHPASSNQTSPHAAETVLGA